MLKLSDKIVVVTPRAAGERVEERRMPTVGVDERFIVHWSNGHGESHYEVRECDAEGNYGFKLVGEIYYG